MAPSRSRAVAPAVMGPGLALPSARARGQRIVGPGMQPRIVPVPGTIPKPTMKRCTSVQKENMWRRWQMTYTAILYAYTMVDFVYQASKKSKDWAKCLWYEANPAYSEVPLYMSENGVQPFDAGAPYLWYWFGAYDTNRMATIRKKLSDMLGHFDDPPKLFCDKDNDLKWECFDFDDSAGACQFGDRIYFKYWENDMSTVRMMVHEITHMKPPGTRHTGKCYPKKAPFYGIETSMFLADKCPVLAMTNADNYAFFAASLYLAVTWGTWTDPDKKPTTVWEQPFAWGQLCPQPGVGGGGGGTPEPCVWTWNSLNQENECIAIEEPPDYGEPESPSLGIPGPPSRASRRRARSDRRRRA